MRTDRLPWALPMATTAGLLLLIALAVGGLDWRSVTLIIVVVAAGIGLFVRIYEGGGFLAIGLANFLALYTCLFDWFVEVGFPNVSEGISDVGYSLPIVAFLGGAWRYRDAIRRIVAGHGTTRPAAHTKPATWFLALAGIAAVALALPFERFDRPVADTLFVGAMGLVGLVVFVASRPMAAFLLKTARLFEAFFRRVATQSQAMFAFLTFYSLIIIVFACLYRIIDLYSAGHHFVVGGAMRDLTFLESLYFSIVSLSTVGYGDITPISSAVRALVAIQTVAGVLLMLFGFSEIIRHAAEARPAEVRPRATEDDDPNIDKQREKEGIPR